MPQGLLRPAPDLVPAVALLLDGEVELELGGELLLAVEPVGEVDAADAAVGVDLDPQRLHVVGAVRAPGEVRQVELDLVPALVQPHRHRADKRLHPGGGLEAKLSTKFRKTQYSKKAPTSGHLSAKPSPSGNLVRKDP